MTDSCIIATPNRVPWPPILFGAAAIAAVGLGMMLQGPHWLREASSECFDECVVALLSLCLAGCLHRFRQRWRTGEPEPHEQCERLVANGDVAFQPFAGSRQAIEPTCQGRLQPVGTIR